MYSMLTVLFRSAVRKYVQNAPTIPKLIDYKSDFIRKILCILRLSYVIYCVFKTNI